MWERAAAGRARDGSQPKRLGLALALAWVAAGCSGGGPAARVPGDVVLVTIDTLRADRLGLVGYHRDTTPQIDRWFADAAVYLRAYGTEASTAPSVVSILSGLLPQEHGVRLFYQLLPEDVPILPDLLPPEYETAAFVSNVVLTDEAMGLAGRFDHFDDFVDERESIRRIYERRASRTTDAALGWLAERADPARPLFLWVHYIDPHGPYRPPEPWQRRFESESPRPIAIDLVPSHTRVPGLTDGNGYVALYDSEVAYVDSQVGRLLEACDRLLHLDDALVILTADHGESMMEHELWFTHGYHVYDEIVRVPLLVRGPGVEPGRVAVPVSGIDIAGTIVAFAGAEPLATTVDLRRPGAIAADRVVFSEANSTGRSQWRAAVRARRKAVAEVRSPDRRKLFDRDALEAEDAEAGIVEIVDRHGYDLEVDPAELQPAESAPDDFLARVLLEKVRADPDPAGVPTRYRDGMALHAPKVDPRVPEDALERLRQLGYAE